MSRSVLGRWSSRSFGLLAALLTLIPASASAISLTPLREFGTISQSIFPEGLAFGVEDVGGVQTPVLYVSNGNSCNPCTVAVYRADAQDAPVTFTEPTPIRSFSIPLPDVRGLDVMPNGNLLVSSVSGTSDRVVEVSRATGALITGGINLLVGPAGTAAATQPESVVFHNGVGTAHPGVSSIFLGEEETPGTLFDLQLTSQTTFSVNQSLQVGSLDPGVLEDPSGMAFDPDTGVLIVSDDSSGGGVSRIYLVLSALPGTGALLQTIDIGPITDGIHGCADEDPGPGFLTCVDPEGVAFDATDFSIGPQNYTGTLFVAFENEQHVLSFGVVGAIPEPNSLGLLGAGLAGIAFLRRKRV